MGAAGGGHRLDDRVHPLLRVAPELLEGGVRLLDLGADLLDRNQVLVVKHYFFAEFGRIFSTSS